MVECLSLVPVIQEAEALKNALAQKFDVNLCSTVRPNHFLKKSFLMPRRQTEWDCTLY